jgi:signal transduction histidine kinase
VNHGHRDSPALLSAAPATTPHKRAALAVMLVVLVVLCATLPFAHRLWTRFPSFILIQQPVQAGNCIIIAALLFGQYSITRTLSLNLLAAGYLFTALMIIAHTLSFPGAFSETGLFPGGVLISSWLYPAWHTVLPMTIIVYTLLPSDQSPKRRFAGARYPIVASILLCVGGAAAITFFITAARDWLPVLVEGGRLLPAATVVNAALLFLPFAALIALALRRPRSILDLWLAVTMFTWLCTISLVALISAQRFDIGWYVGRVLDLLTSTFILLLLLSETLVLYERYTIAVAAERRERERRLNEMEAVLIHLSRVNELGQQVATLIHEITQPLAAISMLAQASLRLAKGSTDQLRETLEPLAEAAANAMAVVVHLRAFIKNNQPDRRIQQIPEIVEDAIRVASLADISELAIDTRYQPAATRAFCDRVQIEQVVFNLVHNAVEAMAGNAPCVLTIASELTPEGLIQISIADTGPGLPSTVRAKLFEPFITTKASGLGVGLSICRVIIEAHGGQLWAEDNHGGGTIFRFTLPQQPADIAEEENQYQA